MAQSAREDRAPGETDDLRVRHGPSARGVVVRPAPRIIRMQTAFETVALSAGMVGLAEIGDKTQLLAVLLAARFGRPAPILLGILVATLANHAAAAGAGYFASGLLAGKSVQIAVGALFLAMAGWALLPDKEEEGAARARGSVFLTTLVAFFLVEIGDKTQIATALLAAKYRDVLLVTLGTTLGMMAANAPAVFFGRAAIRVVPLRAVRIAAAAVFALLGAAAIAGALAV